MLSPIFWKEVQGQKHPGRWEIAERQIPSIKMLFKTNTKCYKHPSIRLFIIEQETIGPPPQKKKKKKKSPIEWDGGAASRILQYWTALLL